MDEVNKNIVPTYLKNWRIILLSFGSIIKSILKSDSSYYSKNRFLSLSNLLSINRLRQKLLLLKVVKFNNQFFSTPTIPAYPSKAYDEMVKKGGLNFLEAGTKHKGQIDSVFLAITNKCLLNCKYCYEKQNINHDNFIPSESWEKVIVELQKVGVNVFILTGGEPLLEFEKLIKIIASTDKSKSDLHLHTSGKSLTREMAVELKAAGLKAAAVGLDDYVEQKHDAMRGNGSFDEAIGALKYLNEAGILTYVNFCANKDIIRQNRLFKYYEFVKELNVSMIQLLEPRPCGGYIYSENGILLDQEDRKTLFEFTRTANKKRKYNKYPLIYYVAHIEGKDQLGCHMGGLSHFYIDSVGNVCPCVFFPVTYGNVLQEDILKIFERMREFIPFPIHSDCPSILLSDDYKNLSQKLSDLPVGFEHIQNKIDKLYKNSQAYNNSNTKSDH